MSKHKELVLSVFSKIEIKSTTNYWSELGDWARFIILGIALAVLIYLGYRGFALFGFGNNKEAGIKKRR